MPCSCHPTCSDWTRLRIVCAVAGNATTRSIRARSRWCAWPACLTRGHVHLLVEASLNAYGTSKYTAGAAAVVAIARRLLPGDRGQRLLLGRPDVALAAPAGVQDGPESAAELGWRAIAREIDGKPRTLLPLLTDCERRSVGWGVRAAPRTLRDRARIRGDQDRHAAPGHDPAQPAPDGIEQQWQATLLMYNLIRLEIAHCG